MQRSLRTELWSTPEFRIIIGKKVLWGCWEKTGLKIGKRSSDDGVMECYPTNAINQNIKRTAI